MFTINPPAPLAAEYAEDLCDGSYNSEATLSNVKIMPGKPNSSVNKSGYYILSDMKMASGSITYSISNVTEVEIDSYSVFGNMVSGDGDMENEQFFRGLNSPLPVKRLLWAENGLAFFINQDLKAFQMVISDSGEYEFLPLKKAPNEFIFWGVSVFVSKNGKNYTHAPAGYMAKKHGSIYSEYYSATIPKGINHIKLVLTRGTPILDRQGNRTENNYERPPMVSSIKFHIRPAGSDPPEPEASSPPQGSSSSGKPPSGPGSSGSSAATSGSSSVSSSGSSGGSDVTSGSSGGSDVTSGSSGSSAATSGSSSVSSSGSSGGSDVTSCSSGGSDANTSSGQSSDESSLPVDSEPENTPTPEYPEGGGSPPTENGWGVVIKPEGGGVKPSSSGKRSQHSSKVPKESGADSSGQKSTSGIDYSGNKTDADGGSALNSKRTNTGRRSDEGDAKTKVSGKKTPSRASPDKDTKTKSGTSAEELIMRGLKLPKERNSTYEKEQTFTALYVMVILIVSSFSLVVVLNKK